MVLMPLIRTRGTFGFVCAPTRAVTGHPAPSFSALPVGSGVFYGVVMRGDRSPVRLGSGSNLQDNVVVHSDPGHPCTIGAQVSVGHGAVVHGCTVEDEVLIGMNATDPNGAVIGTGSLVAGVPGTHAGDFGVRTTRAQRG
jgi:hypothetical protein